MKRILLAGATLLALTAAQPAVAQPMPIFNWSGFYVGLQAGYGWGTTTHAFFTNPGGVPSGVSGNINYNGVAGGGTLGWNWQSGTLVFGLEGDLSWANLTGADAVICSPACRTDVRWFGTARGRLGVAMNTMLLYVTGGVAFGEARLSSAGIYNAPTTRTGWTGGGGAEFAIASNWTGKIEYLYVDLGTASILYPPPSPFRVDSGIKFHVVRAGLNLKF